MADPVSWLVIRPGWKVFAADGSEVGEIDEIAGDDSEDIFDGTARVVLAQRWEPMCARSRAKCSRRLSATNTR
jgi:hypothetical protein